jgi:lipopolysaccharide/colanic/teichoic acid biosynthesis glycosyltransferase
MTPLEPNQNRASPQRNEKESAISDHFFRIAKCFFDFIISIFGLIILSPILIVVSILLKREAPGSVFYHADRLGRHGVPFKMIKFRTMREDTNNESRITANDDNRITPLGRWLRDTKLNELPQLWNVLIGQMSLVGPRPEDPEIAAQWPEDIRDEILSIRPGITSPASVIYRREEKMLSGEGFMEDYLKDVLPDKLRLDYLYLKNRNLLVDFDIILLTILGIIPLLNKYPFPENQLFWGPISTIIQRYFSWFIIDLLVSFFSVFLTAFIWRLGGPLDLGWSKAFILAASLAVFFSIVNTLLGLGKIYWQKASPAYALDLLFSTTLTTMVIYLINLFNPGGRLVSPELIIIIGVFAYLFFVAVRYRSRLITGFASRWVSYRDRSHKLAIGERTLIVGAGDCGQLAAWLLIRSKFDKPYTILGLVDDDPRKQGQTIDRYRVLGQSEDIPRLVDTLDIGLILFAITNLSLKERDLILDICRSTSAHLVIIPDLLDYFHNQLASQV